MLKHESNDKNGYFGKWAEVFFNRSTQIDVVFTILFNEKRFQEAQVRIINRSKRFIPTNE